MRGLQRARRLTGQDSTPLGSLRWFHAQSPADLPLLGRGMTGKTMPSGPEAASCRNDSVIMLRSYEQAC